MIFLFLLGLVWADPHENFIQGKYKQAAAELKIEVAQPLTIEAVENRSNLALEIFAAEPTLDLNGYVEILKLLQKQKVTAFLKKRIQSQLITVDRVKNVTSVGSIEALFSDKQINLTVLAMHVKRLYQKSKSKDLLFLTAKAEELGRHGGAEWLEEYLSATESEKGSAKRKEAFLLLESHYKWEYPSDLPDEVEKKLKTLKSNL